MKSATVGDCDGRNEKSFKRWKKFPWKTLVDDTRYNYQNCKTCTIFSHLSLSLWSKEKETFNFRQKHTCCHWKQQHAQVVSDPSKKKVLTRFPEDYRVVWRKTVRGREHFRKNTVSIRSIRNIAIFPPSIFQYIHIKYEDVDYVFAGNNSNFFSFFMYAVAIRNIVQ